MEAKVLLNQPGEGSIKVELRVSTCVLHANHCIQKYCFPSEGQPDVVIMVSGRGLNVPLLSILEEFNISRPIDNNQCLVTQHG